MSNIPESPDAKDQATKPQEASELTVDNLSIKETASTSDASAVETASPTESSELTRADIEALGSRVRLTDQDPDANLDLYCYVRCTDDDQGPIRDCRGVFLQRRSTSLARVSCHERVHSH